MIGVLASVTVAIAIVMILLGAFPGSPTWPLPGLPITIFIIVNIFSLVVIASRRSWGYPLGTAALLALLYLFFPDLSDSIVRPAGDPTFFTISMIGIFSPPLAIPLGIQGYKESRGSNKMQTPRVSRHS